MVCKITHDDGEELTIPRFLCRLCNPDLGRKDNAPLRAPIVCDTADEDAELERQAEAARLAEKAKKKKRIRKISAEIDRMNEKLKLIQGRESEALVSRLRAAINSAHQELRKAGG